MSITEQIRADMIAAMKAHDAQRTAALRLVLSELQKAAKEGREDELTVLRRERKRRLESLGVYEQAAREELAAGERFEAALISCYLPRELSDEELGVLVSEAVAELGARSPKDMGAVMKAVIARAQGAADGKRLSALVRAALSA